jgi:hypothetical protein
MNWAAMNYVKRLKRESGINGNVRFVMMMIAGRIPKGRVETIPTSQHYLASTTGNDDKTIRNILKKLVALKAVQIGEKGRGRGKFQTYVIPALQGPLFMVPDGNGKPESLTGFQGREKPVRNTGISPPGKPEEFTGNPAQSRQFGAKPVLPSTSQFLSTKTTTATAEKPTAAAICDETLTFLNWVADQHRITVDYERDGPRIEKLLAGPPRRDLALVQAMTAAMFTATAAEDRFVASAPDRGLKLLVYAADRLERIALARRAPNRATAGPPCLYKHTPPCASAGACAALERELVAQRDRQEALG